MNHRMHWCILQTTLDPMPDIRFGFEADEIWVITICMLDEILSYEDELYSTVVFPKKSPIAIKISR